MGGSLKVHAALPADASGQLPLKRCIIENGRYILGLFILTDMATAQPRITNVTTAVSVPSPRPLPLRGTEVPEGEGDEVSLA